MIEIRNDSGKENFSNNKSDLSDFETNSSANEEDQTLTLMIKNQYLAHVGNKNVLLQF